MPVKLSYYLSEAIGTFVMMFLGISAIAFNFATEFMTEVLPSERMRLLLTGIMFAGGATLVIYSPVGRISGAHLNPAVSLAFFLQKKIGIKDTAVFMVVQCLGSMTAAFLVLFLWGNHAKQIKMGMTLPGTGQNILFVFLVEIFITFLLIISLFFFLHRKSLTRYTGLALGILVASLVFLTANISGTSLNPARSLGPAIAAVNFSFLWIYLTAPFVGSILAVLTAAYISSFARPLCAKLNHQEEPCLYEACEFRNGSAAPHLHAIRPDRIGPL
ncbi:MAG: MIP/aquaporin family protein [Desulfobulbaceae bacterium]|nr:MIP/aquaporin family protein [Desulfobulbaceae bacterium]